MTIVGGAIANILHQSNMTQKDCARRLGISEQYLSDIIRGRRHLSARVAVRLSRVLGIDAYKWMEWENHEAVNQALADALNRMEDDTE